jgi:hypothetical protein
VIAMQYVNASLTLWTQRFKDRAGRFIPQAKAIKARAVRTLHDFAAMARRIARAALAQILKWLMDAHEAVQNMAQADKMAVRRMFYANPLSRRPEFTKDGARTIARWLKQAQTFNHNYSPEMNAEMKGMQKMLDFILADLLVDPIDLMKAMKAEEERREEELVHT